MWQSVKASQDKRFRQFLEKRQNPASPTLAAIFFFLLVF
jgi:hypothetical protein